MGGRGRGGDKRSNSRGRGRGRNFLNNNNKSKEKNFEDIEVPENAIEDLFIKGIKEKNFIPFLIAHFLMNFLTDEFQNHLG